MMSGVIGQGLGVFGSYIATPIGAALLLALLVTGGLRLIHRSSRALSVALPVVGAVFGLWVVGGVLEAMGVPVRWMIGRLSVMAVAFLKWVLLEGFDISV